MEQEFSQETMQFIVNLMGNDDRFRIVADEYFHSIETVYQIVSGDDVVRYEIVPRTETEVVRSPGRVDYISTERVRIWDTRTNELIHDERN